MNRYTTPALFFLVLFTLSACGGGSSSSGGETTTRAITTPSYAITYEDVSGPVVGRSVVTLHVHPAGSTARTAAHEGGIEGLSLTVTPWMTMASGMEHSAPAATIVENGAGIYTATVYYLMATTMNDVKMGDWELRLSVNGESATIPVTVAMNMSDTAMATMKNDADVIGGANGAETRSYYLFHDIGTMSSLTLFLATRESLTNHPSVYSGKTLTNENGVAWSVNSVALKVSTDGGVTWSSMVEQGSGYYRADGLTGLADGVQSTIRVKMTINGATYTTNGLADDGGNGWATFLVTPGGMEMGM